MKTKEVIQEVKERIKWNKKTYDVSDVMFACDKKGVYIRVSLQIKGIP